ncbi:MAG: aminotransferase class V-fold PLP-dependent enzyme [Desulfuromonadales bacterium]
MTIYLDNAATSHPKPEAVYRASDLALRQTGASPGRGGHQLGLAAGRLVFAAREAVASLFGIADTARIAFTGNATEAINQALFGLLRPGDRVVTSSMEHNAVTRPLRALQEKGVQVVKVTADGQGCIDPEAFLRACREGKTRLAVLSHCSNVTGALQPVADIGPWCRREGIPFLLDAAQSAGLFDIQVEELGIDLLAAPGHKGLMGPPGTGFLYVRPGLQLTPLVYGGTGGNSFSDQAPEAMPERFEAGTLNTPGLAGLTAAIAFLRQTGLEAIRAREEQLMARLIDGLRAVAGVELYGPLMAGLHGGALSFNLAGFDPAEIGFLLDRQYGIVSRTGLHCAPDAHRSIGTFPRGTIRVSPGFFTTVEDIDHLLHAVAALAAAPINE